MNPLPVIKKYRLHHLLFWMLFFAGWHFLRYQDYPPRSALLITFIKVADLALLVYITNYVLIPKLLYRRKYWLFGSLLFLMIFASSVGKMYLLGWIMNSQTMINIFDHFKSRFYDNVLPHILLVSTGAAFKLLQDQVRAQKRLVEMAREKSEAELNFLKSQINPHFLFNSLNSIYFLIDRENAEARATLLRFSDLLRYQLYDCSASRIGIEKEIGYLRDYIRLQQLRRDKQYQVEVDIPDHVQGFSITPLLLIPFVENAFKHISHHNTQKNFVHVAMNRLNGSFRFSVENSKDNKEINTEPSGGIGLANVKRRLELLYPGKHQLLIDESDSTFKVELELNI